MKTHVGVDLHQRFCYLTAVDASGKTCKQGQVVNEGAALRAWLGSLAGPRQVVVEASGFWPAFARSVAPEFERLVMVHPQRVKAIAAAKLKNDRVDSETLAHLSRCDLLPAAWMADEATQQLRLRVRLRITLGRHRARAKNQLQAVLHQEGFKKPVKDVFGKRGRAWLKGLELSAAGRLVVDTWLREVDHLDGGTGGADAGAGTAGAGGCAGQFLESVPGIGPYAAMVILPRWAMWSGSGTSARWPATRGWRRWFGSRRASESGAGLRIGDRTRCAGSCCRWRRWRPGIRLGRGVIMPGCARGNRRRWPGSRWRESC